MLAPPVVPGAGTGDPGDQPVPWGKVITWVAGVALVVAFIVVVIIPGYRRDRDAEVRQRLQACAPVPAHVQRAAAARLALRGGTATRWTQHAARDAPGITFVSVDLRERGLARRADGEIATWATEDGVRFTALESVARDHSRWPGERGRFDVTDRGAIESRFCVDALRENRWQEEFEEFRK